MFTDEKNREISKICNDLCITNASGQFQMEVNNMESGVQYPNGKSFQGFVRFKKKKAVHYTFEEKAGIEKIILKDDLTNLGLVMTDEAKKVFTGKFTLTISHLK